MIDGHGRGRSLAFIIFEKERVLLVIALHYNNNN